MSDENTSVDINPRKMFKPQRKLIEDDIIIDEDGEEIELGDVEELIHEEVIQNDDDDDEDNWESEEEQMDTIEEKEEEEEKKETLK